MMQAQADNTGAPDGMKLPPVVERIANQTPGNKAPICVLMVGMAGSGKTTLLAQLQQSTMPNETEGDDEEQEESEVVAPLQNDNDEGKKPPASTAASPPAGQRAKMPAYCVNLDPATLNVPYNASIDIRDTVDYKVRSNKGHQRLKKRENLA
jgi:GTPase SAR1 family protein